MHFAESFIRCCRTLLSTWIVDESSVSGVWETPGFLFVIWGTCTMTETSTIPTASDLQHLPRWAKLAFAVRCVRLVQSIVEHEWPSAPEKYMEAWWGALSVAEAIATDGGQSQSYAANAGNAAKAFYAAKAAAHASKKATNRDGLFHAMMAGAYSAKAAAHYAQEAQDISAVVQSAYKAAVAYSLGEKFSQTIWQDYQTLHDATQAEEWSNNTPVSQAIFRNRF